MAKTKRGNPIAKDLRTPKYRVRIVPDYKQYNRARSNREWRFA